MATLGTGAQHHLSKRIFALGPKLIRSAYAFQAPIVPLSFESQPSPWVRVQAETWQMPPFTCYLMGYTTEWGKCRQYHGMTELLRNQDQQAACDVRLKGHLRWPLPCLASGVPGTFVITAVGGKLSLRNCLIQEAINTARALATDDTARGACYSCPKMGSSICGMP